MGREQQQYVLPELLAEPEGALFVSADVTQL